MRVYREQGVFYRFCWTGPFLYISSWNSIYKSWNNKDEILNRINGKFNAFASSPNGKVTKDKEKQEKP